MYGVDDILLVKSSGTSVQELYKDLANQVIVEQKRVLENLPF